MRVLIVTHYFWPEVFRINDFARGLKARGHEVVVLTTMPNYPKGVRFPGYGWFRPRREMFDGDIPVFRAPLVTRGSRSPAWRLALSYLTATVSASFVGLLFIRGRIDRVFIYQPSPITTAIPGILFGKLRRVPTMLWVQDLWPESLSATGYVKNPIALRMVGQLVSWIYRHCTQIMVQSEGFVERVIARGAPAERVRYFPNWAEDFYQTLDVPADALERRELPEGFRIVFAGNIGTVQDFPSILRAAEILQKSNPEIRFAIFGDGSVRSWVESEIRSRGLEQTVVLLGSRPAKAMPRYFACADALLVTLTRDPIFALTIPGKLQSYLACGKPIVASLEGEGARAVESAQAGLVAVPEDAESLARTIRAMAALSSEDRALMGRRARQYYEQVFDRDMLLEQLESWMKTI